MAFELFCATMIALLFGLAVTFGGYRLFLALLPIWGFIFGFGLGAQTLQVLFGYGFLATATSWVVGFIVGALFGVLSYMFYIFGVALLAGSVGYSLGVGVMVWLGLSPGFITWIVGIVLGIVLITVTLMFNLQKYMIVIGTAVIGAGLLIGTLMMGVVGVALTRFVDNPIQTMLQDSPLWTILFLVLAVAGIIVQLRAAPVPEIDTYASSRI
ncbi:MAG: DUF4203 domain-containing protein [Anaerolineales bacterium]|jgi:hypothetical protein